jgi:DNA polymerase
MLPPLNDKNQKYLVLDYETRSEADLRKTGAFEYANHPTTQILCVAWRLGTRQSLMAQLAAKRSWEARDALADEPNPFAAKLWSPAFKETSEAAEELDALLMDKDVILVAHNALFEQVITRFVLARKFLNGNLKEIPHDRWICTAALAAALALPRNLEGACAALQLPIQKDMDGRRLILKYCKPRKLSKNNKNKWHNSAGDLRRIMLYCQNDVDAETLLFLTAPPLSEKERKVWLLDQKINFRGFEVDRPLVKAALQLISEETINLNRETTEMTGGRPGSTTQRDAVLKWLHREGVFLPDLRAKTVSDAIKEGLVEGEPRRLLEIRQAVSKTSTKKYSAFETRSRTDGRVRDILVYHTASTGRWGGSGVQPQNFPRGTIDDTTLAAEVLRTGDLECVRLIYGNPMDVLSSCLRAVIRAPEGRELFCADYAAIEARVLFWVAKHATGVKSFLEDRPVYEEMATVIYGLEDIKEVTKPQRQVGKQSFLGCGYGMGWKKFLQTCKHFGMEVDEETAQAAVSAYRSFHRPVVTLWSNLEKAAIAAVKRKGTKYTINRTKWWVDKLPGTDFEILWCQLPSGRKLSYPRPEVRFEPTSWGDKRPVLYHWSQNTLTRQWECTSTYGGKLSENVVQAIARDLMAEAMLTIERAGYELILSVHDELLAERQIGEGSVKEFEKLMGALPPWAEGCPVKVAGWSGHRYRK